jgi:hypothetical protein
MQRSHFATQSRFSKILRLLLSVILLVMSMIRSGRVGIGVFPPSVVAALYCYSVHAWNDAFFQAPKAMCTTELVNALRSVLVCTAQLGHLPCLPPPSLQL